MSEISLYIDSHLVGKRAKRIFSRLMWMVFGFGLNHTPESSVRAKYTIYLPSFLAAIHYYVALPLLDILFITMEPLLIPSKYGVTHISAERFHYGYTPCRCFLPSFGWFGQAVSVEKNLKNQPIRNKSPVATIFVHGSGRNGRSL